MEKRNGNKLKIDARIPLLEEILSERKNAIGADYEGYKNHVYRMINFCFAQKDFSEEERRKIIIAGCFHDIGIWTGNTFDYLSPSIAEAENYLRQNKLENWIAEINSMIELHHKIRKVDEKDSTIEIFRRGDLIDFSLGFVKCGLPNFYIKSVKRKFPNAGFHKCLLKVSSGWFLKHPLNPVPVLKW